MPAERVTMARIAEMAGVSPAVVSAVVRGDEPRIFVSESTRQRVMQIVAETQYQLPRRREQPLACAYRRVALLASGEHLTVFGEAIAEVSRVLNDHECVIGIHLGHSAERRWQIAAALHEEKQAQGAILIGSTETLLPEWAYKAPVVMLGEVQPEDADRAWSVRLDNAHAGQTVADYLWHLRHRRAGVAGALDPVWTRERVSAFRSRWVDYGGEFSDNCIFDFEGMGMAPRETLAAKLGQFLECAAADGGPLTALFCVNDYQAAVMIRTLRHLGYRVPQDMSIVGVDDRPLLATAVDPQLTTIRQPFPSLGRVAAELLLERLDGQRKPRLVVLPGQLIERESCLAAPGRAAMRRARP